LGVATPSELIKDKKRTPFNIGKGIELTGFEFAKDSPLINGFSHLTNNPEALLKEILAWTGGQPFLTQKICDLIRESQIKVPDGEEVSFVENLVRERVIENWESHDDPEHFKTIRDRILKRDEQKTAYLLDLYQQIWQSGEIDADNSIEQSDLQLAGIVVKKDGKLKVYNCIYYTIFDNLWIEKTLAGLRPYADSFRQWLLSGKNDKSRLLRGEALAEAEAWVADKNLGFEDREFLAASRTQEQEEKAIKIEAEAKQEAEKQLAKARRRVNYAAVFLLIAGLFGIAISKIATDAISNLKTVEEQLKNAQKATKDEQQKAKKAKETATEATNQSQAANQKLNSINERLVNTNVQLKRQKEESEKAKKDLVTTQNDKKRLEEQKNKLNNDTKQLQKQLQSKSQEIKNAANQVLSFQKKEKQITFQLQKKQSDLNIAEKNTEKAQKEVAQIRKSIEKTTELSAVASELQQKGKNNEANQFLNIAGLVLQDKIKNQELKEALLASSLVLGYEYLENREDNEDNKNSQFPAQYEKAKEEFNKSITKLPKDNQINNNDPSYLATLVYIYYVKGKLDKNKALENYETALSKYNLLQSKFKSKIDLFKKLDLNILYNGNADIVASLYRQLNDLDSTNPEYHESLKTHLLAELDYLMQENRWKDADLKNDQFLLVSAKREKERFLRLNDVKNFNCKDLKAADDLWVRNSKGKFGFSVQKRIWKETGNSLDFDWEKGEFTKWSDEGYNKFAERVGWKKGKEEGGDWMIYDELPLWEEKDLNAYKLNATLPSYKLSKLWEVEGGGFVGGGVVGGSYMTPLFLQRLVDCSR
jgi:hypothetical protein